jgi:Ca2+-binding RTX toxin-like protein
MQDYTLTNGADFYVVPKPFGPWVVTVDALGGDDTLYFELQRGDTVVYAGDGNDQIYGPSFGLFGTLTVYGGNGNDYVAGAADDLAFNNANGGPFNLLYGGAGDDTLLGNSANQNSVYGGDGNDWIALGRGIAWGDAGNDTIIGSSADIFPISARGDAGADFIFGSGGADTLSGDEGPDLLVGREGDDWLYTGPDGGTAYGDGGNDVLVGAADGDTLVGGLGNDAFYGYAGRDWLYGEDGNDTLLAGDGDDVLIGGAGDNYLDGGLGDDVFITIGTADQVFTGDGHNYVYGYATSGGVIVTGGSGIDEFVGGNGASNDTVAGLAGNDYLYGGGGNDLLQGGADNDVILGQAGNDTLEGGAGVNLLWANDAGNDQILVNVADGGTQVLEFFEAGGTNDVVRLLGSGLTSFAGYEALRANIGNVVGVNQLINAGSGAQLYLNVGANQTAIWFQGVSAYSLTSGDFLFV